MLLRISSTAIGRVIQCSCTLFLRRCFPIPTVTRRNVESVSNKELMGQNKSILEKVVVKESQTTAQKGISIYIMIKR